MKKAFTAVTIVTAVLYAFVLYCMLFRLFGRQMVIMSESMLDNYNYWNSVNLIPFKTIIQYITAVIDGSIRGHAIRNLVGNLLLFFPAGFYLPFFMRKMSKLKIYGTAMAALIISIEITQVLTMTGSLDVDDFILNFAGALISYLVFTRTPARSLFNLRAWQESDWVIKKRIGLSHLHFIKRRCNMPDFIGKSKAAYNKKADDYDNTPEGRFTREFQRLIVTEIVLRENDNVLDVACGNGSLLAALNEKTPINGFGVDISDRMIANAATKNPGMHFYVSGCEAIPFGDASMDAITVCAAYHHFPDTSAFSKEAARVLKPSGRIYIAEIYLPTFLRVIINPFVPLSKEGDVRFYSTKGIHRNFKQVGFEPVNVKLVGHIQIVTMKYEEQPL